MAVFSREHILLHIRIALYLRHLSTTVRLGLTENRDFEQNVFKQIILRIL